WYALGVMLYEALTGVLPRAPRRSAPGGLRAPVDVDPDVPPELSELCLQLLSAEPAERPDAREIVRGLRGVALAPSPLPEAPGQLLRGGEAELARLEAAFQAAERGELSLLSVEGESGIGKTALLDGFAERLVRSGRARVLRSRCLVAETSPYKGVDGLIDA